MNGNNDNNLKGSMEIILPEWTSAIINHYTAGSYHQFLIDGNIHDFDYCEIGNRKKDDNTALPTIFDLKGFHHVRTILINALFFAMPSKIKIEKILYFSRTLGVNEISSSMPSIPNGCASQKVENSSAGILDKIDIKNQQMPSSSLTPILYQLDKALNTRWSFSDGTPFQIAVIIDNVEQIIPDNISSPGLQSDASERLYYELIHSWGSNRNLHSRASKTLPNLCIMITENRALLPPALRCKESGTMQVNVPIPDMSDRLRFFESVHNNKKSTIKADSSPIHKFIADEENRKKAAMLTKGFSIADCDRILAMSNSDPQISSSLLGITSSEENGQKILDYFQDQTDEVIKGASKGMLEIVNSNISFNDIGGLEGAKNYFRSAADAVMSENIMSKQIIPKGVLLAGPPGTGKSLLAKALAQETKLNLVRMGNIRSMWVGESEKNLNLTLNLLKSMSPVIVFVDEIDQALGARSSTTGDSGVSGRIFQQILEFMGDNAHRGEVIWVAATNRVDLIDDALVSRFDRIIPVLLPGSKDEWKSVMIGIFNQLDIKYDSKLLDEFLNNNENYKFLNQHSGRSMETVFRFALQKQLKSEKPEFTLNELEEAFNKFKTNINVKVFELQTLLAIASCNDTSFVTRPGENGYSYGFGNIDELVETALRNRNNDSLENRIRLLKSELGYY